MTPRSFRNLACAALAIALITSCDDEPVAGTTDEAQTSLKLQLVADNLRPIPGDQAASGSAAGRALGLEATDSACLARETIHEARFEESETEGMEWMFRQRDRSRWGCRERYPLVSTSHGRNPAVEWWVSGTTWMEGGDPVAYEAEGRAVTPSGFRYEVRTSMTASTPGLAPDRMVQTIFLTDFGWKAEFLAADGDPSTFVKGVPLLEGATSVGRLAIDTLTGAFRVFDLKGREVLPRPQVFPPVAADSLGVRVVGIRRDTVDGAAGLLVSLVGRLPADSGLSFRVVRLSTFGGPSEDFLLKTVGDQPWPAGATSASLFFADLPLGATHIRVSGELAWDRPVDPAVYHSGEFLTRILPIP